MCAPAFEFCLETSPRFQTWLLRNCLRGDGGGVNPLPSLKPAHDEPFLSGVRHTDAPLGRILRIEKSEVYQMPASGKL